MPNPIQWPQLNVELKVAHNGAMYCTTQLILRVDSFQRDELEIYVDGLV